MSVRASESQSDTLSSGAVSGPRRMRVQVQLGVEREVVCVSEGVSGVMELRRLVLGLVERKVSSNPSLGISVTGLEEKLMLFRHEPQTDQMLHRLTERHQIHDGDLLEVVFTGAASVTQVKYCPHSLVVQSYRSPTFCHFCGEMLWGLVRQGLRCEGCGLDFHKRCAVKLENDCSRVNRRCGPSVSLFPTRRPRAASLSTHTGGSLEEISMTKPSRSQHSSWAEVAVCVGASEGQETQTRVPHTFHIHSYTRPTACQHCFRLLKGLFRQGLQCSDCKLNCHRHCQYLVPADCKEERTNGGSHVTREAESEENGAVVSVNTLYEELRYKDALPPPITVCFSSNIPLMRVVQSMKHSKRKTSSAMKKSWLIHHTSNNPLRKRHYWLLDSRSVCLYLDESSCRLYQEVRLSEVLQVRGAGQLGGAQEHSLELVTAALVYYVFAGEEGPSWVSALRLALRPVQDAAAGDAQCPDKTQDVGEQYQIFSEEVLGSGQFGVVYAGVHRLSGREVAVKVIEKARFPSESQTRNEGLILQKLSHPGVIALEQMFSTTLRTFVVMEKLHSDMLEMILSQENGRLTERSARFFTVQILEALRYLHSRHVVHCDLKPENVLLASTHALPQVKLSDFGFARIIGEKSFRRTVVGTAAYLAPEVISQQGYNRALDMWAMGVVLYVSLSGTFPFNEDEDVQQQITNASFMYPRQPWSLVSLEAVNLINNLLQVVVRRRFSVGKAQGHAWLKNFQLWCDLREFERRLGLRYLTHAADDQHWRSHARDHALSLPPHLAEEESDAGHTPDT